MQGKKVGYVATQGSPFSISKLPRCSYVVQLDRMEIGYVASQYVHDMGVHWTVPSVLHRIEDRMDSRLCG